MVGSDLNTLQYIKQLNNKDLLYSTGNYTQYSIITYNGKESEKESICMYVCITWASLVVQTVKRETQVRPLGREDLLEKEMASHSSILAWKIPWTGQPGGLQSMGSQRVGHD